MVLQTFKKIGGQIMGVPQKSQRLVTQEPVEMLKTAREQILGTAESQKPQESVVLEALRQSQTNPASAVDTQRIKAHAASRMEELRGEIARLVAQRHEKKMQWRRNQEQLMGETQTQKEKPIIVPTAKRKPGMMGPGQKKGGTKEMGKQM